MLIKIIKVKENPDGSADVNVRYDKAGLQFLVQQGLTASMVEAIVQY
jgi:predicted fused transcriptional regulator/phosphomethylpyrimidine kinase